MKFGTPCSCLPVEQKLLSLWGNPGTSSLPGWVILCPALCTKQLQTQGIVQLAELSLCLWNKTSGTNLWLTHSSREIPHPAPLPTTRAVIWVLFKRVSAGADQTLSLHFLLSAGQGGFILFHNEGRGHSCCPWNSCDQLPQPCCPFPILGPLFLGLVPHFTSSCAPDKTWRCKERMTLCHCY